MQFTFSTLNLCFSSLSFSLSLSTQLNFKIKKYKVICITMKLMKATLLFLRFVFYFSELKERRMVTTGLTFFFFQFCFGKRTSVNDIFATLGVKWRNKLLLRGCDAVIYSYEIRLRDVRTSTLIFVLLMS